MGMRFQRLREQRISSRGRSLGNPKVEPPGQRLTSGHMTQAQTQREAHQRQAHPGAEGSLILRNETGCAEEMRPAPVAEDKDLSFKGGGGQRPQVRQ